MKVKCLLLLQRAERWEAFDRWRWDGSRGGRGPGRSPAVTRRPRLCQAQAGGRLVFSLRPGTRSTPQGQSSAVTEKATASGSSRDTSRETGGRLEGRATGTQRTRRTGLRDPQGARSIFGFEKHPLSPQHDLRPPNTVGCKLRPSQAPGQEGIGGAGSGSDPGGGFTC